MRSSLLSIGSVIITSVLSHLPRLIEAQRKGGTPSVLILPLHCSTVLCVLQYRTLTYPRPLEHPAGLDSPDCCAALPILGI